MHFSFIECFEEVVQAKEKEFFVDVILEYANILIDWRRRMKAQDLKILISAVQVLKAVAHPARLEIIGLLDESGSLSVGQIQERLGTTQSMTSQHLAALKRVGILACQKEANVCYYSILNRNILKLLECISKCATGHP